MSIDKKRRLLGILTLLALAQAIVRFGVLPQLHPSASGEVARSVGARIDRGMYLALSSFGVQPEWVKERDRVQLVRLPADMPARRLFAALRDSIHQAGGAVRSSHEDERTRRIEFSVVRDGEPLKKVVLIPDRHLRRSGGRIALIIDDWGYSDAAMLDAFLSLSQPLSFAVIPGLPGSREAAERIRERGRMLLVHLPMEPLEGRVENNGFTILGRLSEAEIRARIRRSLDAVPGAAGINNHMGSKATVDPRLLSIVMDEIHRAGLFFVDSRTNPQTVAYAWAERERVPTALNDLFLDVRDEDGWIRSKLDNLAQVASRKGQAVGIGHPKPATLEVLRQKLPQLEGLGYRFVPVAELVR